jgi:hypothetical protein
MTYGQYNRYDDYRRRMLNLYNTLRILKKYRVLIACGCAAICAAIVAFLFAIGSFTAQPFVANYVYGEYASPTAKAFLSEVSFEYAPSNSLVWSSQAPTTAGEYQVRATSENGFGDTN